MKINRILLISAPLDSEQGRIEAVNSKCFFHLGLLTIKRRLKHFFQDLEIKIVDGDLMADVEKLKEEINSFSPDMIGISALTPTYKSAIEIAEYAKNKVNVPFVVLGNDHASFFPELILEKRNYVDFIIKNDNGDLDFVNLVSALKNESDPFAHVSNLCGRINNRIRLSPTRHVPLGERLTGIEFMPNFGEIDNDAYTMLERNYNEKFGRFHPGKKVRPFLINNVVGCRNCSRRCMYCSIYDLTPQDGNVNVFWESLWKYYSEYDLNFFFEVCDNLGGREKYVSNLIKCMPAWFVNSSIDLMIYCDALSIYENPHIINNFRKLHVRRVNMGLDAGDTSSLKTLKNYKSAADVNSVAVEKLTEAGIQIHCSFIIGCLGESSESIDNTVQFINRLKRNENVVAIEVSPFFPLPNSPAWELFIGEAGSWFKDIAEIRNYLASFRIENYEELWGLSRKEFSHNDIIDLSYASRLWTDYFTNISFDSQTQVISSLQKELSSAGKVIGGFA
jgi:radical SAM superfamily enzyme YgiQ (UPF0313 family)